MSINTPPPPMDGMPAAHQPFVSQAPKPNEAMAILAIVFGSIAAVLALIPFVGFIAWVPAIAAIILGILVLSLKKPGRTKGLIGLILGGLSILLSLVISGAVLIGALSGMGNSQPGSEDSSLSDTSDSEVQVPEDKSTYDPSEVTYDVSVPSGFEDLGTGLAFRFIDDDCYQYDYCVTVEVFAYTDCPQGIDVVGNEIDYDSDTIFDETYEQSGIMYAGDTAIIELGIFNPRANGVQLTDLVCYY